MRLPLPQPLTVEEVLLARRMAEVPGGNFQRIDRGRLPPESRKSRKRRSAPTGGHDHLATHLRPLTGVSPSCSRGSHRERPGGGDNLVKFLTDKCNSLATRLQQLEDELFQVRQDQRAGSAAGNRASVDAGKPGAGAAQGPASDADLEHSRSHQLGRRQLGHIDHSHHHGPGGNGTETYEHLEETVGKGFDSMSSTMDRLHDVFSNAKEILAIRIRAATCMSSLVRMYLQKKRYSKMRTALKSWKRIHSVSVLQCLCSEVHRQSKLQKELVEMRSRHSAKLQSHMFLGWAMVLSRSAQRRVRLRELEVKIAEKCNIRLCKAVLHGWWGAVLGPNSVQAVVKRSRARMSEARLRIHHRMQAAGETQLVITSEMVKREMNRQAVSYMQERMKTIAKANCFKVLLGNVMAIRDMALVCRSHFEKRLLRNICRQWKKWAFLSVKGLNRNLMAGYSPTFGIRANLRRVEEFSRRRVLKMAFTNMAATCKRYARAKKMGQKHITCLIRRYFDCWHTESHRQHRIKNAAVGLWHDQIRRPLEVPFRMWYIFTDRQKRQRSDHERLVRLYRRVSSRRTAYRIFRAWHHQSVYGRIESLYTRPQLMSSLVEEKAHSAELVAQVREFGEALSEMEGIAFQYRNQTADKDKEIKEQAMIIEKLGMSIHHAEQDIIKVQSLLDICTRISPAVYGAVLKECPGFNFRDRGLTPFARARLEKDRCEAEQSLVVKKTIEKESEEEADGQTKQAPVETANAKVQVGPSSVQGGTHVAARAALAAAAIVQGVQPPMLPTETAVLDRAAWALQHSDLSALLESSKAAVAALEKDRLARHAKLEAAREDLERMKAKAEAVEDGAAAGIPAAHEEDDDMDSLAQEHMRLAEAAEQLQHQKAQAESITAAAEARLEEAQVAQEEMAKLAGLHEFIRTGSKECLPPALIKEWEARPDAGLGLLPASHQDRPRSRGSKDWMGLTKDAQPGGGALTWHDFRSELVGRIPKGMGAKNGEGWGTKFMAMRKSREAKAYAFYGNSKAEHAERLYNEAFVIDDAMPGEAPESWEMEGGS